MENKISKFDEFYNETFNILSYGVPLGLGFVDAYFQTPLNIAIPVTALLNGVIQSELYADDFKNILGDKNLGIENGIKSDFNKERARGFAAGAIKSVPLFGLGYFVGTTYKTLENML